MLKQVLLAFALAAMTAAVPVTSSAQVTLAASTVEIEFWNSVKDTRDPRELEAYLSRFPDGTFAALAKLRIEALKAGPPQGAAPAPGVSPPIAAFSEDVVKEVQRRLYDMNFAVTSVNGRLEGDTLEALKSWQRQHGFEPNGVLTNPQVVKLRSQRPPTKWAALAYTASGQVEVQWNQPSRRDAETNALLGCQTRGSGACKVIAAALTQCIAAASFRAPNSGRVIVGTFAARNVGMGNAQLVALANCNKDQRSGGRCEIVAKVCADGSHRSGIAPPTTPPGQPQQPKRPPKGDLPL